MKGGALGRAVDSLVLERMNEKNAERMLENVKQRVESIATTGVQRAAAPNLATARSRS